MSLRTIHVHKSEIRTYNPKDVVDRPNYMYIEPTGIHELNPNLTWEPWANTPAPTCDPIKRPLRATNPKMLGIFCSQMNRDPSFIWSASGTNSYTVPVNQDRIIDMSGGVFVSPSGLVYRHTDICVGTTDIQKNLWSDNRVSHLMPAHSVNEMMAFPLEASWLDQPALYILMYLSKVLDQAKKTPSASFWCKRTAGLLAAIKLFPWNQTRGRLLEYDGQTQVFSNSVYGRTSHGIRILPKDIEVLRETAVHWSQVPLSIPTLAIIADPVHIKDELLKQLEEKANACGYAVRIIWNYAEASDWSLALSGVSRIVISTSLKLLPLEVWPYLWMCPRQCKVLELQEEREPSNSLLHLCSVADLEWTLLQYPRSTLDGFRKIVGNEFVKWMTPIEVSALPIIYTPMKSMKFGFFGHKGDSFREMIDLWVERGYVERKEDSSITECWLNKIGDVLLYDRPTWTWLEKSDHKEYKVCLTGNPDPSEKVNAKPWTFWPRNPRLVETMASLEQERTHGMVFFGRIENDVQAQYRHTDISGWQNLCSKFSLLVGAKTPYALNPEEYLLALKSAKYGLCLRGYGPKCNREIELLAMGTVPVVVTGVDITNYAEPLIDGIHVLCVSSPEEAKEKMAAITESQWETMSKAGQLWWKNNASVDGSWSLTRAYL